ncbi:MAG: hypothetical protein GY856_09140, partial [bacterium]|nr:hypothetical protein [bacterium]
RIAGGARLVVRDLAAPESPLPRPPGDGAPGVSVEELRSNLPHTPLSDLEEADGIWRVHLINLLAIIIGHASPFTAVKGWCQADMVKGVQQSTAYTGMAYVRRYVDSLYQVLLDKAMEQVNCRRRDGFLPALVWEVDCSQRSSGARDENLVILLLFVATNDLEELLLDCGPLPASMLTESGDELLAEISRRLDALGIEEWRTRTCGVTSDSGSNFVHTLARRIRDLFCANIAVLPDPAHRGMHAVEDGLLPSVPYQGLYVLVAELRSWLASDKRRRMMARLLEEFP